MSFNEHPPISKLYISYNTEDAGWIKDSQLKLEQFIKEQDLISSAKLLAEKRGIVKL